MIGGDDMTLARDGLYDFNEYEREVVNDLFRREFKDATPDEMLLYAEWEATNAVLEERATSQAEAMRQITQAAVNESKANEALALAQLEALEAEAREKLERAKHGKAEQEQ